jgi:ABC-type sulfate transport system substrate-binding protein
LGNLELKNSVVPLWGGRSQNPSIATACNKVDIVYPSLSILAEPPVKVVDKTLDRKGTRQVAEDYMNCLFTDEGQDIAGKNFYRPISPKAQAKYVKQLPKLPLFTIDQAFGGWAKADKDHLADGGSFDQIYLKK